MNLSSTFQAEVFRPVATIAVPGVAAVIPYILILTYKYPDLLKFWDKHELTFITISVLWVIAAGLILEDIGSEIELLWDRCLKKRSGKRHDAEWYQYLSITFEHEPIGHKYLRTVTLRMKFELAFSISLIPFWAGVLWLHSMAPLFSARNAAIASGFVLMLCAYLLRESYNSSALLAKLRHELLKGVSRAH